MKLYVPYTNEDKNIRSLNKENIWLINDGVGDPPEESETIRNVVPYICFAGTRNAYKRYKYESLEEYFYYEVKDLQELYDLLKQNQEDGGCEFCSSVQVWYERGYLWIGYQPE